MAFDQPTRNRLARFVTDARATLSGEFARQLRQEYGLDPDTGRAVELDALTDLDDARRETARILRETLAHYLAGAINPSAKARRDALDRIVREQAYTVLNRLCALRMAEARGLLIESVGRGYQSRGFQLYARLAGTALGETGDAYRSYLFSLFDEFAVDLAVLFDRYNPQGRLFPGEGTLLRLLDEINHPDIEPLWAEDETIGWIYQYFNSDDERRQMRKASQAPRNSRELAVRNQFFTPRYVVEFLTDNTLGRIWYEMTQGQTDLVKSCRYLVRRPVELFLRDPDRLLVPPQAEWGKAAVRGDFSQLPESPSLEELSEFCLIIDGYELAQKHDYGDCIAWADRQIERYRQVGTWPDSSLELWMILFRQQRYYDQASGIQEAFYDEWYSAYRAFQATLETEGLSQEELLQRSVYIPYRALKDPREIAMLDPACGSMHFGLYAFDLFERIYAEAWDMQADGRWPNAIDHRPLAADYASKASFLRDVPRLIIEHNIHGLDIDPRAVQIAGLSLWLRAQRSWQAQGLKSLDRPRIRRSNIVCAEPMPGDKVLLDEFLRALREDRLEALIRRVLDVPVGQRVRATERMAEVLCDLVRTVWHEMALAGEAGSLLKIEGSLAEAVAKAEDEWLGKWPLFRAEFQLTDGEPQVRYLKRAPGEETDFWGRAEALVLAALEQYAEQVQNGSGYQRRLFANDAVQGFAFIDLCHKRYDIVLMNPPFGYPCESTKALLSESYFSGRTDLYACSVLRAFSLTSLNGLIGSITARTGFYLQSFSKWRSGILALASLECFADLGGNVLDSAMVETAAHVFCKSPISEASFFRIESEDKAEVLCESIASLASAKYQASVFLVNPSLFEKLPDRAWSYWISSELFSLFSKHKAFDPFFGDIRLGVQTNDDFRFARLWWEVANSQLGVDSSDSQCGKGWIAFLKGGESSKYLADISMVLNWFNIGNELKAAVTIALKGGHWSRHIQSVEFYFLPGISWALRTDDFDPHIIPAGCIPSVSRYFALPRRVSVGAVVAVWNTPVVDYLAKLRMEKWLQPKFVTGVIKDLPFPLLSEEQDRLLKDTATEMWKLKFGISCIDETSRYALMPVLQTDRSLAQQTVQYSAQLKAARLRIRTLQHRIEEQTYAALGCSAHCLDNSFGNPESIPDIGITQEANPSESAIAESLASYTLGSVFGRWDIRFATDERPQLVAPDPLAPLPAYPPGMLQGSQGLPTAACDVPVHYPLRISWTGILVDDESHAEDIQSRVREALHIIWSERADAVEQELCEILAISSLREYFGNPNRFFDDHLKLYSKSRRYAPIYWPLSTPSGAYTLWLYYHRLSDQILYTCVNDFVDPKIDQVRQEADQLRRRSSRSSDEERELERLIDLALELRDFRAELLRIAAFWKPDLNDGVQITAAPLWRLFQHRAWQKRLRGTWERLEAGDYDWAHLAMSCWPARVVPKCVDDRSLSIAHDLESLFWVEDADGWRVLRAPEQEIADQKQRRQVLSRNLLRDLLAELAGGLGMGLPAYQVSQHLAEGDWDDMNVALCLWPERVAEKCWADSPLALKLGLHMPAKRTKSAHKRFVDELVSGGTPDLATAFAAALQEDETPFDALWAELERGDRDDEPLALALWPDRVVEKCVTDVDLAVGHDLRRLFWYKPPHGTWRRRKEPRREIADEIARRQTNTIGGG